MSELFERPRAYTNVLAFKRTLVVLFLLACVMVVWPTLRHFIVQHMVASSIGFGGRSRLIAQEVNLRFATSPTYNFPYYADLPALYSCREPTGGMIFWASTPHQATPWIRLWSYADGDFSLKGKHWSSANGTAIDADQDGLWEVPVFEILGTSRTASSPSTLYVLRFKDAATNELVGIIEIDRVSNWTRGTVMFPKWQDLDADGIHELTIVEQKARTGKFSYLGAVGAEFGWSEPGGVLVPLFVPEDGTVKFWPMPNGKPVSFSSDELVDEVVDRVMAEHCEE